MTAGEVDPAGDGASAPGGGTDYRDEGWEELPPEPHEHLRANPGKRKGAFAMFLVLAFVLVGAAVADILFLDSVLKWGVLGLFALLLVWGLFLLFSRRIRTSRAAYSSVDTHQWEDEAGWTDRALLRCPDCQNIFEYSEDHLDDRRDSAFSCPVCGRYSHLPKSDAEPVRAPVPEGDAQEVAYVCMECHERIRIGTFGEDPHYESTFRTCPHCGVRNAVVRGDEYERMVEEGDLDPHRGGRAAA